ncbi:MAG: hypothetical protein MSA15_19260 [Clostridium sp.]|nr:hypothetical protein [Clostridium sp.]
MKSARELFKKLGYELIEDGKTYLRYANYFDNKKYMGGEMVDFDKKNKRFRLTRKSCQGNIHFKYGTLEELQAINQQINELGWK